MVQLYFPLKYSLVPGNSSFMFNLVNVRNPWSRELLMKRKAQYSWPPHWGSLFSFTDFYRSAVKIFFQPFYSFCYKKIINCGTLKICAISSEAGATIKCLTRSSFFSPGHSSLPLTHQLLQTRDQHVEASHDRIGGLRNPTPVVCHAAVETRWRGYNQGIPKGEVSLYHWPPVWLFWISLFCK